MTFGIFPCMMVHLYDKYTSLMDRSFEPSCFKRLKALKRPPSPARPRPMQEMPWLPEMRRIRIVIVRRLNLGFYTAPKKNGMDLVDGSEIRRKNHPTCMNLVNNGDIYLISTA